MPITWRARSTGREVTLPEPGDRPVRAPESRARHIARMDASPEWERAGSPPEEASSGGLDDASPETDPAEPSEPSARDVRRWARDEGIDHPARGPLPDELIHAFKAAQE